MKKHLLFLLLIVLVPGIYSQTSLYINSEFLKAYNNKTRSYDGRPGQAYWQNSASYVINAELNNFLNILSGKAVITYKNNSPNVLEKLYLRAYPNINKPGTAKDWNFDESEFTEGMVFKSFLIDGSVINLRDPFNAEYYGTNIMVKNIVIPSGASIKIEAEWEYTIPSVNAVRTGNYQQNYFIAYWYPQVAVYDDIDGWDNTLYSGEVEFYNDFNNYDVKITVPSEYYLWATGELQNPDNVMIGDIRKRYIEARNSNKVVRIIQQDDIGRIIFSNNIKTYHFTAENVTDFAFCAAKTFLWDGKTIDINGKKVFVSAMYDPDERVMHEIVDLSSRSVEMFSADVPGIAYPYPAVTIFNGSGGMEYPMLINQGGGDNRIWTINTAVHEISHMYFPFYTGINERKYAWMDEGLAQMLSEDIQFALDSTIDFRKRNVIRYLDFAGTMTDVPMMISSRNLSGGEHYAQHAYFRSGNAFRVLRNVLGAYDFKKSLQEFIHRWKGKHPTPYDLFFTFNDVSGKDLSWFWKPWFFEIGIPDIGIKEVTVNNENARIIIEKYGSLPIPVSLKFNYSNGNSETIEQSAEVWKDNTELVLEHKIKGTLSSILLGSEFIPDAVMANNKWGN